MDSPVSRVEWLGSILYTATREGMETDPTADGALRQCQVPPTVHAHAMSARRGPAFLLTSVLLCPAGSELAGPAREAHLPPVQEGCVDPAEPRRQVAALLAALCRSEPRGAAKAPLRKLSLPQGISSPSLASEAAAVLLHCMHVRRERSTNHLDRARDQEHAHYRAPCCRSQGAQDRGGAVRRCRN